MRTGPIMRTLTFPFKITCAVIAFLFTFSNTTKAQYFYDNDYYNNALIFEVGISVGAMNCLTDIGGKKGIGAKYTKDLNLGVTEFVGGVYFGAMYKDVVGLRLEGSLGKVSSFDSVLNTVPKTDIARARYNRNLSFRSNITEIAAIFEFHPLYAFIDWEIKDYEPPRFSPYVLGGISYFKFRPQGKLNNRWIDLQPLSTEGQGFAEYPDRKPYSLKAIGFPVGAGVRYDLSPVSSMRLEFVYRPTNTDYMDDVSTRYIDKTLYPKYFSGARLTNALLLSDRNRGEYLPQTLPDKKRGNIKDNDNYFSVNLKLGLVLGRDRR